MDEWIYNIRGCIDRGKCRHFRLLTLALFIGQFVNPEEEKGLVGEHHYLSTIIALLEYMKIWCNIQVIIYRFVDGYTLILNLFNLTRYLYIHLKTLTLASRKGGL